MCLEVIKSGAKTQRAAAIFYGIPRSTIKNKLKGLHDKILVNKQFLFHKKKKVLLSM
jgi:hypothetical protein